MLSVIESAGSSVNFGSVLHSPSEPVPVMIDVEGHGLANRRGIGGRRTQGQAGRALLSAGAAVALLVHSIKDFSPRAFHLHGIL